MKHLIIIVMMLTGASCASTPPVAEDTTKDTSPSACVQTCTDARRTEAIDWAVIVSECEASCATTPTP